MGDDIDRRTFGRRAALLCSIALAWMTLSGAHADTAPYHRAGKDFAATQDELGMATSSAHADALLSGDLSVAASSRSDSPAGIVSVKAIGAARAHAYSYIEHNFYNVSAGSHAVDVFVDVKETSATFGPAYGGPTAGSQAYVRTSVYAYFIPSCSAEPCPQETHGYHGVYTTDNRWEIGRYQPGVYHLTATFTATRPGRVLTYVFLAAVTQAAGPKAQAAAAARANVMSITIS